MDRPTGYPEWALATSTGVVNPTDAKKQAGWGVNEKPPAQFLNWLHGLGYQWNRYLDVRSYLEPVVQDDFAANPHMYLSSAGSVVTNTGLSAQWGISGPSGWLSVRPVAGNTGVGVLLLNQDLQGYGNGVSGVMQVRSMIGRVDDHDFRLEFIAQGLCSSGAHLEVGLVPYGWAAVPGAALSFVATGSTNYTAWALRYAPSGISTPTLISMSAASGYHKIAAERLGATMTLEVDGRTVQTIPGRMFGATSLDLLASIRDYPFGAADLRLDKIMFGMRRNPI